jgi:hypothetical protein
MLAVWDHVGILSAVEEADGNMQIQRSAYILAYRSVGLCRRVKMPYYKIDRWLLGASEILPAPGLVDGDNVTFQ